MGKKKPPRTEEIRNNPFAALAPAGVKRDPVAAKEPASTTATDPFLGKLVLRREKKGRGGKTITRLSGIAEAARTDVVKQLKKGLGCGAMVEGEDIILLGSLVDRAADWLEKQGAKRVVRGN